MTDILVPAAPTVAPVPTGIRTPWSEFWRKFRRQRVAVVALGFIGLLVVVAVLAPWIVPYDPVNDFDYDRINEGPRSRTGSASIPSGATS